MCRKRVLQLVDFSLSGYAAHYAVVRMHESEPLDVLLLVVGIRGRFPAPESVRSFAEMMADAHRVAGGAATLRFSRDHPRHAVHALLTRERFDLVVVGSELAAHLEPNRSVMWKIVQPTGAPDAVVAELWPFILEEQPPPGPATHARTPDLYATARWYPRGRNGARCTARTIR